MCVRLGYEVHRLTLFQFYVVFRMMKVSVEEVGVECKPHNKSSTVGSLMLKASLLQSPIEIGGAADIFAVLHAVFPITLIQLSGLFLIGSIYITALVNKRAEPVVAFPVRSDCVQHALRAVYLEIGGDH